MWRRFLRFAFHQFYNPFAFSYDFVSHVVSRGRWRTWTRSAIPHVVGPRVLELAFGTGHLLVDLRAAGLSPIGVDLSAAMIRIAQKRLLRWQASHPERGVRVPGPALIRARAQRMPFADCAFDSIVMTFPPEFVRDPRALAEIHRLLAANGRLIWVDAGRLLPRDLYSRLLNFALDTVGGKADALTGVTDLLARSRFQTTTQLIQNEASVVAVVVAMKR